MTQLLVPPEAAPVLRGLLVPPHDLALASGGLDPRAPGVEHPEGTVYVVHLLWVYTGVTGKSVKYFGHYTGHAEPGRLAIRMAEHGTPAGSRVLQVAYQAGIPWILARTYPGGYDRERQLKRRGTARRYCPACGVKPRRTP